ncbi:MAG TPA: ABC transporter substrate-binding protein [Gaiellaceae bacterium]|nr:ABC transporter substrate-binding protein [Gaiellaceae bacterium]
MGKLVRAGAALAGLSLLLAAAASGAGARASQASDTLVFGTASDPALLDPALVSDGESLRVTDQMFESLVGYRPGTTRLAPELATSWRASRNGLVWTFNLRRNVRFHDGTPFNAAAVCFNFNRWYNFPPHLQPDSVSYYWRAVFGGFRRPARGSPGPGQSLYRGCRVVNEYTVQIQLRRRSASFLNAIGLPNFAIASPTALRRYRADAGRTDKQGVFRPSGTFATRNPVGTGPFRFVSWSPGNRLELERWDGYWGRKAILRRIIFRPIPNNAARLQALQTGEIQGYDLVEPADFTTVQRNRQLRLLKRPPFSVGYVGINQQIEPMDNPLVRRALAHALDKRGVIGFYAGQGQIANQFLPPALPGHARSGVPSYPYNPARARQLLRQAGLELPVRVTFWYPTGVSRPYMPDPRRNAEAFGASLERSGFDVEFRTAPWSPDYLGATQAGRAQLYLLGWIADYPDPANFLNVHFGQFSGQFGFRNAALFNLLRRADAESNVSRRIRLYEQASRQVMRLLPMVPYVWAGSALAFRANVRGYVASPIGPVNEPFGRVSIRG